MKTIPGTIISALAITASNEELLNLISDHLTQLDNYTQIASDLKRENDANDLNESYKWFESFSLKLKQNQDINPEERNHIRMNMKHDLKQIISFYN